MRFSYLPVGWVVTGTRTGGTSRFSYCDTHRAGGLGGHRRQDCRIGRVSQYQIYSLVFVRPYLLCWAAVHSASIPLLYEYLTDDDDDDDEKGGRNRLGLLV